MVTLYRVDHADELLEVLAPALGARVWEERRLAARVAVLGLLGARRELEVED